MPTVSESVVPSFDAKADIFVRTWLPESAPHAALLIVHGMAEHSGRYTDFAAFMAENGYAVRTYDQRGHGRSAEVGESLGSFGESDGWELALQDLRAQAEAFRAEHPGLPFFILGHGMGSLLVRCYIIRWPGDQFGAILSGTGQLSRPLVAIGHAIAKRELRRFGPNHRSDRLRGLIFGRYNRKFAPNRTPQDWRSRDKAEVDAYIADPLCGKTSAVSLYVDLLGGVLYLRRLQHHMHMDPHLRVLFISGQSDPMGGFGRGTKAAWHTFVKAGMKHVKMRLYPGARHDILHEENRTAVFADILAWAEQRIHNKTAGKKKTNG